MVDDNTIIVTRTLDAREAERLREKLRELWPGEGDWTIVHGQVLRNVREWGPSEFKAVDSDTASATPLPRWEA